MFRDSAEFLALMRVPVDMFTTLALINASTIIHITESSITIYPDNHDSTINALPTHRSIYEKK